MCWPKEANGSCLRNSLYLQKTVEPISPSRIIQQVIVKDAYPGLGPRHEPLLVKPTADDLGKRRGSIAPSSRGVPFPAFSQRLHELSTKNLLEQDSVAVVEHQRETPAELNSSTRQLKADFGSASHSRTAWHVTTSNPPLIEPFKFWIEEFTAVT